MKIISVVITLYMGFREFWETIIMLNRSLRSHLNFLHVGLMGQQQIISRNQIHKSNL